MAEAEGRVGCNTSRLRLESGQERLLPEIGLFANAVKRI
jgi:hypothetical protein